jgi:ABC-type sugar transport system permease subunit
MVEVISLRKKRQLKDFFAIGVCLAPSTVLIFVFAYFAFACCIFISFNSWDMLSPMKFIGLKNYIDAFNNSDFWNVVKNTFLYVLIAVPSCVVFGLMVGLLLDWVVFAKGFFRVMLFLPVIVSMVIASTIWKLLLDPQVGEVNRFLYALGIKPSHWTRWLSDSHGGAMAGILLVGIWKRMGYNGVLFLGGLKNISDTLYEAAIIDGANSVQKFFKITIPLLSPTTFIVTMLQLFASFKVVESVLLMTGGGPAGSTEVMVVYIYNNAFRYFKMGYAASVSVVLFVIILSFTIIQLVLEKKMVFYQ